MSVDRGPKLASFPPPHPIPLLFLMVSEGEKQLEGKGWQSCQLASLPFQCQSSFGQLFLIEYFCGFLRDRFPGPQFGWCFFSHRLFVPIEHDGSVSGWHFLPFGLMSEKDSSRTFSHFQTFPSQNQSTTVCSANSKKTCAKLSDRASCNYYFPWLRSVGHRKHQWYSSEQSSLLDHVQLKYILEKEYLLLRVGIDEK